MKKILSLIESLLILFNLCLVLCCCNLSTNQDKNDQLYQEAYDEGFMAALKMAAGVDYASGYEEGYEVRSGSGFRRLRGWRRGGHRFLVAAACQQKQNQDKRNNFFHSITSWKNYTRSHPVCQIPVYRSVYGSINRRGEHCSSGNFVAKLHCRKAITSCFQ